MARIVMTIFGSAGDLNPFLAIATGLRARGHEIVFAVEESFWPPVEAAGFAARRLTGDSATMLAPYARQLFIGAIQGMLALAAPSALQLLSAFLARAGRFVGAVRSAGDVREISAGDGVQRPGAALPAGARLAAKSAASRHVRRAAHVLVMRLAPGLVLVLLLALTLDAAQLALAALVLLPALDRIGPL